jgi:type IV secretion system protein VirB10
VQLGLERVSGDAIAAALIYALQTRRGDQSAKELYSTENRTTADGLAGLPRDYAGIPKLGPPLPGVRIQLADDGEVLVHGPMLMRGYRNNPKLTAEAIDPDGWLHTGDVGALDGDGYLTIVDRKKELRNAAGKTLAPVPMAPPVDPNAVPEYGTASSPSVNGPVDHAAPRADPPPHQSAPYVVQAGTVIPAALITLHSTCRSGAAQLRSGL